MIEEVKRATERAQRLYDAQGFIDAYVAGARAALSGKDRDSNPYRTSRGGWGGTYKLAWVRGYLSIDQTLSE